MRRGSIVLALLPLLALTACGSGGKSGATTQRASSSTGNSKASATPPSPPTGTCRRATQPTPRPPGRLDKPTVRLDPTKIYRVVLRTSCGEITITLDQKHAPVTAASFYSLARRGFYDRTYFHRIVPTFAFQGGDPTGYGRGGPGYRTVEPPPADTVYTRGVVAMAKSQREAPGTGGSQFFVVTGQNAELPPIYALVGRVTGGLGVAQRIGRLGDPVNEQPTRIVVVYSALVKVS